MSENKTTVRFKMMEGCDKLTPHKAHADDAAFDLSSRKEIILIPGKAKLIPTGLFIELPLNYEAQIRPRSGLALKYSLTILNSPGTVDSGYRGEVGVIMLNAGIEDFTINYGDRIAQMVINELPKIELIQVDELTSSQRGTEGFGSTGKN